MNKQIIALACIALSGTVVALASPAEARGGRGHHHIHYRVWTPTFESSSYDSDVVVRRRIVEKTTVAPKPAPLKYADGQGRQYDLASRVWFDGKSQCWSGKDVFLFKNGVWFYGNDRWYEVNGVWKTNAAEPPATIDCEASPIFAAKLQPSTKPAKGKDLADNTSKVEKEQPAKTPASSSAGTIKTAEQRTEAKTQDEAAATKATECKKYFPSVGEMLTVPCNQ